MHSRKQVLYKEPNTIPKYLLVVVNSIGKRKQVLLSSAKTKAKGRMCTYFFLLCQWMILLRFAVLFCLDLLPFAVILKYVRHRIPAADVTWRHFYRRLEVAQVSSEYVLRIGTHSLNPIPNPNPIPTLTLTLTLRKNTQWHLGYS